MASYQFPYSYYSCPCTKSSASGDEIPGGNHSLEQQEDEEQPFDPRSPRANYSLYPLDHLMWCEDCHEIRCPRCTVEEVVCWYCPSCLFEVASGMVKSEGNRCTRNCFNCPICTAPLAVNSIDGESGGMGGPWILACDYCNWTTLDINIQFDKPNNIYGQLQRILTGKPATRPHAPRTTSITVDDASPTSPTPVAQDHDARFAALRSFYTSQLAKSQPNNPLLSPGGQIDYNSPSSLARIMSIYTNSASYGKKAAKATPMRSAETAQEGLLVNTAAADEEAIARLRNNGFEGTANAEQRENQLQPTRFVADLRPVPTLLRTKRSRRCKECRHILVRPEPKVTSTRFRIKLVAYEHVPSMTLVPLPHPSQPSSHGSTSASGAPDLNALPPSRPLQFLLTLRNPMFDAIKVTLATPATTSAPPGQANATSRVTILCPQFEIGSNTDVWDEALTSDASRRMSKLGLSATSKANDGEGKVAEAGKVWDKGRNWTTIVLEVVCGRLEANKKPATEDEDVLEIPIFVRIEYETMAHNEEGSLGKSGEDKEKRELAYWSVLGVGKIAKVTV